MYFLLNSLGSIMIFFGLLGFSRCMFFKFYCDDGVYYGIRPRTKFSFETFSIEKICLGHCVEITKRDNAEMMKKFLIIFLLGVFPLVYSLTEYT